VNIKDNYPYIIAEIGGNHNGDLELAKMMIDSAIECGVDAVKFQLYDSSELITKTHLKELNDGIVKLENISTWTTKEHGLKNIYEQIEQYSIQEKEHVELFEYCRKREIEYATTILSVERIQFLVDQKVSFLKIASLDINNLELIIECFKTDIPVVISTGLASMGEIENVINIIPKGKESAVTFLHCTSLYPPTPDEVNLSFMNSLQKAFGVNIGYSDHTIGFSISLAAVALGATIIEKHFTLDKDMPGWDHKVSANPGEMKFICLESRNIVDSLGSGLKVLSKREEEKKYKFRRSATAIRDIKTGDPITKKDIAYKRPGTGVRPDEEKYLIGRIAKCDISNDQTITFNDLV
jgi:sialic acid synthase SpsE